MTTDVASAPDTRLMTYLVCPISKRPVYYDTRRNIIISPEAQCVFPVRNGIPVMLPEEAQPLDFEASETDTSRS